MSYIIFSSPGCYSQKRITFFYIITTLARKGFMCEEIQIGIQTLICVVSDLKAVTNHLLNTLIKKNVQEEFLYSVRLFKNRLDELFEKLSLVYDGVQEDTISPLKKGGNRLEKLFEKLVQESRESITLKKLEKRQQLLNEDVDYQRTLAKIRQDYEEKGLVFDEDFLKGNPFHQQQISTTLYQEIIAELRQYCEDELLAVIDSLIPSINFDDETQKTFERIQLYLQAMKEKEIFL